MTNIRLSRETDLRTCQMPSFSEEARAQNEPNFHWSLTVRQRRWLLHLSPVVDDLESYEIKRKHDKLQNLESSTGRTSHCCDPFTLENNAE